MQGLQRRECRHEAVLAGVHVMLNDHFSPDKMGLIVPKTSDGRVLSVLSLRAERLWLDRRLAHSSSRRVLSVLFLRAERLWLGRRLAHSSSRRVLAVLFLRTERLWLDREHMPSDRVWTESNVPSDHG